MRALPVLLAALALGPGCTLLLDSSIDRLPCDARGGCLDGYVCSAELVCVPESEGACSPVCGAFEECVRSRCVPSCVDRPCGAGQVCTNGACVDLPRDGKLGSPCDASTTCGDGNFCVRPYGGGNGLCTRPCADDAACGDGTTCREYATGRGPSLRMCAPAPLEACDRESDCVAAGLSCGLFAWVQPGNNTHEAVKLCRTRVSDARAIGEACISSGGAACANGICLAVSGNQERCLTPCSAKADCAELVKDAGTECLSATVEPFGSEALKRTRAKVCVPGGATIDAACTTNDACHADAPYCVEFAAEAGPVRRCAPAAAEGSAACPDGFQKKPGKWEGSEGEFCAPK
jgi:hypothetical protein